jgi:hypothetical protein
MSIARLKRLAALEAIAAKRRPTHAYFDPFLACMRLWTDVQAVAAGRAEWIPVYGPVRPTDAKLWVAAARGGRRVLCYVRDWGEFMSKRITVTLADGRVVVCAIVERSYRHDADARAAWCYHDGREFVAVRLGDRWRAPNPVARLAP